MPARSNPFPAPPPSSEPGEASGWLCVTLKDNQQTSNTMGGPADPSDRLPLSLVGRCLTPEGVHVVCEAVAMTARGLIVACEAPVQPGESISVNLRGLGKIAGVVDRSDDGWFVLDVRESSERLAALSKRLLWTIGRQADGSPDRRLSERFDQNLRQVVLISKDGRETPGEMVDLSATGAAVRLGAASPYFWVGQEVFLGARPGLVRRHFPGGIGIEFDEARPVDEPF